MSEVAQMGVLQAPVALVAETHQTVQRGRPRCAVVTESVMDQKLLIIARLTAAERYCLAGTKYVFGSARR